MGFSGGGGGGSSSIAFSQGTAAARPAATPNALYYATDTGEWWIANAAGNAWQSIRSTSASPAFTATAGDIAATGGSKLGSQFYPGQAISNLGNGTIDIIGALLRVHTLGQGLAVAEGANAKQGLSAAMVTGSVTVANTSITATSRIQLTRQDGGTNPGAVYVSARVVGTSFTITSTNAADTGTVAYEIFEVG